MSISARFFRKRMGNASSKEKRALRSSKTGRFLDKEGDAIYTKEDCRKQ